MSLIGRSLALQAARPRALAIAWGVTTALAAGQPAALAAAPSPTGGGRVCEVPEDYVLPNGMEVRLLSDHSLPAIAVVASVHAGFRHDPQGYEGLAHYVEHLTFRLAQPHKSIEDLDATIGAIDRNASTNRDTTDYFAIVPPEQLETALWIEARRLAVGLDTVEETQARAQREVILREHILRYGDGAPLTAMEATTEALFPEGHPYRRKSQTKASQEGLTLNAARWFFARHYRPEHVRLVLLGDFQAESAKALIAALFGPLQAKTVAPAGAPGGRDLDRSEECRIAARPNRFVPRRVVIKTQDRRERLELVWPVLFGRNGASALPALSVLTGRVEIATREQGLADRVWYDLRTSELGQSLVLEVDVIPGKPFQEAEALARSEIARLERDPVSEDMVIARRQAAELVAIRESHGMLDRAFRLTVRACQPRPCFEPAVQITAETFTGLERFDPREAVVVEHRFSGLASPEGDVESIVVGTSP